MIRLPFVATLLRLRVGKPTKRRTQTAPLSNTLHYIDRTETSPPKSKLLRADTGGIKNPPSDSNYTASREQSRARQAEQVPPLTAPNLRQPPKRKSSTDKRITKSKTSSEKKY